MKIERHDSGPRMSKSRDPWRYRLSRRHCRLKPQGQEHGRADEKRPGAKSTAFSPRPGPTGSNLPSANIWITDMANFAEMNAVWDGWVLPGNTPARATVEAGLASPDYKVEIMVVAAR